MVPSTEKIKSVASSSTTAKAIFALLAERERSRKYTNIKRMRRILYELKGVKASSKEIADIFERLEQVGVGQITRGRGNKPSMFAWKYKMASVAKAAQGGAKLALQRPPREHLPTLEPAEEREAMSEVSVMSTGRLVIRKSDSGQIAIEAPALMTDAERQSVLSLLLQFPAHIS